MPPRSHVPDLLDEALEFLWTTGYGASSVEALIAGTALNRHKLYAYFGSKRALAQAAEAHYLAQLEGDLEHLPLQAPIDPPALARAWQNPRRGSCLGRLRRRGCFARRLADEVPQPARETKPAHRAVGPLLRGRLRLCAPDLPEASRDALCAVLLADLEPGCVEDLAASLEVVLAAAGETLTDGA